MSFFQTSYPNDPPIAVAGQVETKIDATSQILEAACSPGVIAVAGTGYGKARLPTEAGDITGNALRGLVCYRAAKEPGDPTFAVGAVVPVLRQGRGWVLCDGAVSDDLEAVFVVHASTGRGRIRANADTDRAALAGGIRVLKGAASGGLALCEFALGPVGPQGIQGPPGE